MKHLLIILFSIFALTLCGQAQNLIKSNMMVRVSVAGVPPSESQRLSNAYQVDSSGKLTMPLLEGSVSASGVTGPKLAVRLSEAYKKAGLYSSPVFTVTTFENNEKEAEIVRLKTMNERLAMQRREEDRADTRVLHADGNVKRPGEHKFTRGSTIRSLLSKSGGPSEFGSKKRVVLIRNGNSTEYNYSKNPKVLDYPLQPGDFIEVPRGTGFFGTN